MKKILFARSLCFWGLLCSVLVSLPKKSHHLLVASTHSKLSQMDYSRETATCSKLTLLWSRHELTVSLSAATYAEANVSEVIQGRSLLWVLPRMIDTRSLRLHCRQCNISKLTVNGKKATWQMLDPLERIVCDDKLACDGEGVRAPAQMIRILLDGDVR